MKWWSIAIVSMQLVGCKNDPLLTIDASATCSSSAECSAPTAVCDVTGSMVCVECTTAEHDRCTGASPACVDNTCQPCTSHAQCDSGACLPDGTCAPETEVAFVKEGGSGSSCTRTTPCGTLGDAINTNRPIVKIAAGLVADSKVTMIDGKSIILLADAGAKLGRTGTGEILDVTGGADVKIFDLEVTQANGIFGQIGAIAVSPSGIAARLALTRVKITGIQGNGVSVAFGGTLTVSQCVMSGNTFNGIIATGGVLEVTESIASDNGGNGINASGALAVSRSTLTRNQLAGISARDNLVSITNNFIVRNGGDANPGGLQLANLSPGSKVESNTIVGNVGRADTNSTGGVFCSSPGFVANNNIIFRNRTSSSSAQTLGTCTYGNSIVMPGTTPIDNALNFVNPNSEPFDYHLTATSPAINSAGTCMGNDFDGDPRPNGIACDVGADEFKP